MGFGCFGAAQAEAGLQQHLGAPAPPLPTLVPAPAAGPPEPITPPVSAGGVPSVEEQQRALYRQMEELQARSAELQARAGQAVGAGHALDALDTEEGRELARSLQKTMTRVISTRRRWRQGCGDSERCKGWA